MADRIHATVEELRLMNFRAFENARLQLSDLTFLVGRNGAGKTSILDAVELLREAVTDNLENALDRRGGLSKVRRHSWEQEEKPSFGVVVVFGLRLPGGRQTRATYGFELVGSLGSTAYEVRERLRLHPEGSFFFERHDDQFTASQITGLAPPPGNLVLPLIARSDSLWEAVYDAVRSMRVYDLSPSAMEASSKIGHGSNLEKTGANAGDALKAIEGSKDHRWVERHLAALIPGLSGVRTEVLMGRRMPIFTVLQQGVSHDYDASQVSQGTLRSLGILLALRQQPTPALVLVDEIENSVHPSALGVLLDAAEATKDRVRIVFTTHSPEVLDHPAVSGDRVRVVDWRDGASAVYHLNAETTEAVSEIETVGSMLRSNALWADDEPDIWTDDIFSLGEAGA